MAYPCGFYIIAFLEKACNYGENIIFCNYGETLKIVFYSFHNCIYAAGFSHNCTLNTEMQLCKNSLSMRFFIIIAFFRRLLGNDSSVVVREHADKAVGQRPDRAPVLSEACGLALDIEIFLRLVKCVCAAFEPSAELVYTADLQKLSPSPNRSRMSSQRSSNFALDLCLPRLSSTSSALSSE